MAFHDRLDKTLQAFSDRIDNGKTNGHYYYFQPIDQLEAAWVHILGERKLMLATYNYLGLLQHPRIVAAAKNALDKYGTGTHGVRMMGGTLDIHHKLEQRIAQFFRRDDAIVFSSGYITNLTVISHLIGRDDYVISDKMNHASIVDGCLLSRGHFLRFKHNDTADLENKLKALPSDAVKLVVADAIFSMDGDIINLPEVVRLCRFYRARLMIDEAHSFGVLGQNGRGIEEHFDLPNSVDICMGTLSKVIPGIGGFIAADAKLINFLRHTARGFVFSAALPPSVCATAIAAIDVIEEEGVELRTRLLKNSSHFIQLLNNAGFDTGLTETAIVPIMTGSEEKALQMTQYCQQRELLVLPVLPPAVPQEASRLRVNVTALHSERDIEFAAKVLIDAGKQVGLLHRQGK